MEFCFNLRPFCNFEQTSCVGFQASAGVNFYKTRSEHNESAIHPKLSVKAEVADWQGWPQAVIPSHPCFYPEAVPSPRGRVIMNSVNEPGSVSTSILPPCCLTMMSWVIERPSPVPSPVGLVVKKGLNIFSLTSGGIPVPLSRIRISTLLPRSLVVANTIGSTPAPPFSVL